MRLRPALLLILAAAAAHANSVSDEVFVNSTQATAASVRSTLFTNALHGVFDMSDDIAFNLGADLTFQSSTPGTARSPYGQNGSVVTLVSAGIDWSATDNLTLGFTANLSPSSSQYTGTFIGLRSSGVDTQVAAQVLSQSSMAGFALDVAWDTLGKSDLEWSFDAGMEFSHYDADQGISAVDTTLTRAQIRQQSAAYCTAHPQVAECRAVVQGVVQSQLQGSSASLDFERLSASVLATLFVDTDVSLSGDYYLYNQDPAAFFVPNQVLAGRSPLVPIAPLQYLLRPEVLHRFGAFSARLWVQAGEYARGTGYGTVGMGTKLQYRFSKALRLWVTASGQRDVDYTHQATFSGTVSAGVGYRW